MLCTHWIFLIFRYHFRLSVFLPFWQFRSGVNLIKWPTYIDIHIYKISHGHLRDFLPSSLLSIIGGPWRKLFLQLSWESCPLPSISTDTLLAQCYSLIQVKPKGKILIQAGPTSSFSRSCGLGTGKITFSLSQLSAVIFSVIKIKLLKNECGELGFSRTYFQLFQRPSIFLTLVSMWDASVLITNTLFHYGNPTWVSVTCNQRNLM